MSHLTGLRGTLKRGALVVAANWPVVVVQFVAQSIFTLLLVVFASAFTVVLRVVAGDLDTLATRDLRGLVEDAVWTLGDRPAALGLFLLACLVVVLGGSGFTFLVKAGTTSVLVTGNRRLGSLDRHIGRETPFRRAQYASVDHMLIGVRMFGRRFLRLGALLVASYGVSFGAYGLALVAGGKWLADVRVPLGWPLIAVLTSVLVVWITLINLVYQLAQVVMTSRDIGVRDSLSEVWAFLYVKCPEILVVFSVALAAFAVTFLAAVLGMALVGFIWFVPFIGLAVVPLQVVAWLARDLVFQYVGHTATVCYATLYHPPPAQVLEDTAASALRSAS